MKPFFTSLLRDRIISEPNSIKANFAILEALIGDDIMLKLSVYNSLIVKSSNVQYSADLRECLKKVLIRFSFY